MCQRCDAEDRYRRACAAAQLAGISMLLGEALASSLTAVPNCPPIPPLHRTPVTRDGKIYLASYQCVPEESPPRRLPRRALLSAGRANAGQHLSPTRRRRKASSNSLPAFWAESNRSVPQDGIRLACRSPRAPSFQAQRASTGLDDRVNKYVNFHPTGKRGCDGPPGHCALGPAVVQSGASGVSARKSPLADCSALRFCSFEIPPKTPTHVRHKCARANHLSPRACRRRGSFLSGSLRCSRQRRPPRAR
jgi:hypothetical protein